MAIIRLSPIIGGISGTTAGMTFANTRSGVVLRRRPLRPPPSTSATITHRNDFAELRRAWRDLSQMQRDAWNTLAQIARVPNSLAIPRALSGFALFVRQNSFRQSAGVSLEQNPPDAVATKAPTALGLSAFESSNIIIDPEGQDGTTTFLGTLLGARPRRPPPVSHFAYTRVLGTFTGPFDISSTIDPVFDPVFGHPVEGEIIWVSLRLLEPGKLPAPPISATAVVQA